MMSLARPLYLLTLLLLAPLIAFYVRSPQRRRPRRIAAFALHLITIAALAVSLSGPVVGASGDRVNVLFVLDRSDSLDGLSRAQALETIERVLQHMGENDTAGLVVFGADASVEVPPSRGLEVLEIESLVDGTATNIAGALRVALAAFPEAGENRIVLLTDGNENRGTAREVAGLARSAGVPVYAVPLSPVFAENEIAARDIIAPSEVRAGQPHEFTVLIHSRAEAPAKLTLFRDGRFLGEQDVSLSEGNNSFPYTGEFAAKGLHRYEVIVSSTADTLAENNRMETFVRVAGPPSVLYIAQAGRESAALLQALTVQGIQVTAGSVLDLPTRLSDLIAFDAVILDNVPAFDVSLAKMELLERYVRDSGGGLIAVGGESAYGLGGYYKTPVERALPVDVDAPLPVSIPSLSLIILIDKSGSMAGLIDGGATKLDLVKEAAYSAVELLNPLHRVGILAFDADVEWVVRPVEAGERDRIARNLFAVDTGGGTDLYEAYAEAVDTVAESPSATRHIIILSDGLTQKGDFEALTGKAVEARISVSTVAVGDDADRQLMADIADWGGGRGYYTDDVRNVPKIFASETMIVSRGLISEEPFFPRYTAASEIMRGFDPADLPPLEGFVRTYLKAGAKQILTAVDDNPLLATRSYGLGRTAAFTADLGGRWSGAWLGWESFPRFAAQLVRWTQRAEPAGLLRPELRYAGGRVTLAVDAVDAEGGFVNFLELEAMVLAPEGRTTEIGLEQVAPGRYSGAFQADRTGSYFVTLYGGGTEGPAIPPQPLGLAVSYPEEYVDLNPDLDLLVDLASRTGGGMAAFDSAEQRRTLFEAQGGQFRVARELWPYLALAALLAFVVEVAVRRLIIPAAWRRKLALPGRKRRPAERALTYDQWEELIDASRRRQEQERMREGIIPLFKREREAKREREERKMKGLYITGRRRG